MVGAVTEEKFYFSIFLLLSRVISLTICKFACLRILLYIKTFFTIFDHYLTTNFYLFIRYIVTNYIMHRINYFYLDAL